MTWVLCCSFHGGLYLYPEPPTAEDLLVVCLLLHSSRPSLGTEGAGGDNHWILRMVYSYKYGYGYGYATATATHTPRCYYSRRYPRILFTFHIITTSYLGTSNGTGGFLGAA